MRGSRTILALMGALAAFALLWAPGLALAAAPQYVEVSGTDVTDGGWWTTNSDYGLTPVREGEPYTVHYYVDGDEGVLELYGATISGDLASDRNIHGAGIFATSDDGSALNLRIVLDEGDYSQVSGDIPVMVKNDSDAEAPRRSPSRAPAGCSPTASGPPSAPQRWAASLCKAPDASCPGPPRSGAT